MDDLPDILDRVRQSGERFVIESGGKPIAMLSPVAAKPGVTGRELTDALRDVPRPDDQFADDLEAIQGTNRAPAVRKPGITWRELAEALQDTPWPDEDFAKDLEEIHASQLPARIPEWLD